MDANSNALNWFEIPVTDMQRARHFYQVIFGIHMEEMNMPNIKMALFPYAPGSGKASGALALSDMHTPSPHGVIIYLNGDPDLSQVLEKIEPEGGNIIIPKTQISPDFGYMAFFIDTEGNRIALHSQN